MSSSKNTNHTNHTNHVQNIQSVFQWKDKYREYTNLITDFPRWLIEQNTEQINKALFESEDTQYQLRQFQQHFTSFINDKNTKNINIKIFNFKPYYGLISKLAYGRHDGQQLYPYIFEIY